MQIKTVSVSSETIRVFRPLVLVRYTKDNLWLHMITLTVKSDRSNGIKL